MAIGLDRPLAVESAVEQHADGDHEVVVGNHRVLVIAHSARRGAFRHLLEGESLEDLVDALFTWQPGCEYVVPSP